MPCLRDHEFNVEQAEVGKEMIQQWRQRMVDNQKGGGGDILSIPARLRNHFDVRFKPRDDYVPPEVEGHHCKVRRISRAPRLSRGPRFSGETEN